jgi:carbon monoxide dehydrogenase subunit G
MRVEKEFTVGAPLERAWPAISDLGVLAACIPGAQLQPADDAYTGQVELTLNGGRMLCQATLRAVDRDEDEHTATARLHARQVGGPAVGAATLRSRCEAQGDATRVVLSAELLSSGYQAGADGVQSAAAALLGQAADALEQRALRAPAPPAKVGPEAIAAAAPAAPVPAAAAAEWQRRLALAGGAVAVLVLLRRLFGRRRSGLW